MPIYEYECSEHGLFDESRPMQRSREGAECPACGRAAPRVLSPTRTTAMPRAASIARSRNEQSRHEPRVVQQRAKVREQPRLRASHGHRPWVLEHG